MRGRERRWPRKTHLSRRLRGALALSVGLLATAIAVAPASAEFGVANFDVTFENQDGTMVTQAGSHPFAVTTSFEINSVETPFGGRFADEPDKDLLITEPPGFMGKPTATPRCSNADFLAHRLGAGGFFVPDCPYASAVGIVGVKVAGKFAAAVIWSPVYNLEPPPGMPAVVGFWSANEPVSIYVGTGRTPPYSVTIKSLNTPQVIEVIGAKLTLWGVPASPTHDSLRSDCISFLGESVGECSVNLPEEPFITLPGACQGPATTSWEADSWPNPGKWISGSVLTHDDAEPPNPQGFTGCGRLAYAPEIEAKTTSDVAESGSGLDFNLDFHDEGLANPQGLAGSDTRKAEVFLPEGVTINPSVGEGLGVCTPADYAREELDTQPGEGCPNSSKVGSLEVEVPVVDEPLKGSIFLAQEDDPTTTEPGAENPFDSLIALYFVIRNTNLGAITKLPAKIEPDPRTGQLVMTIEEVPQFPVAHFNAHLREGQRAALVTPPACGTYTTEGRFYPWSDPDTPRTVFANFEITEGRDGPCPPAGVPPFHPAFQAGSIDNNAGSFSPFDMRLTREDGEQDMTKFSAILPPGELGSLAGVSKCPDAAIAAAKAKTGKQELASPSCPASSLIGHTLTGAGVGGALTYVKGFVYLGGPYHGEPLSVVAVTPALAGPFDAGTVVVREALSLNPKTAEVEVDGAASDPIPHVLKGIVLKVRNLRLYIDRPNFTLNPTSCDESSARAVLFGSYLNVLDPSDDRPVDLSTRYQAANCLSLGFKPKLSLDLSGGTKRGGHPALRAIYEPRPGDANVKGLVVRLPSSAFLDQAHIKTICTRVQFAARSCPRASRYGYVKAWTPLLNEPLEGPVYLRSSNHKLPDLVFDLRGLVDVEVSTRIGSARGGIRATVEAAPDAPLSKVLLTMQGARKGLIVNSRDLCARSSRAAVLFTGHNGKREATHPLVRPQCGKKGHRRRR